VFHVGDGDVRVVVKNREDSVEVSVSDNLASVVEVVVVIEGVGNNRIRVGNCRVGKVSIFKR
jgi:hypothetical protein